jgi:hypothetical protein
MKLLHFSDLHLATLPFALSLSKGEPGSIQL